MEWNCLPVFWCGDEVLHVACIRRHSNPLELPSVLSIKILVDAAILPKEYGGSIPLADMIKELKLKQERAAILALDDMQIELTTDAANFAGNGDVDSGVVGSFRKFEVD